MPAPAHTIRYSYAEYVAFERSSNVKHETLIVEVLSRSTELYDRGEKFEHYKSVPSLRQYVLVSHRDPGIEVWTRSGDGEWRAVIARAGELASLGSIDASLDLTELYDAARPSSQADDSQ